MSPLPLALLAGLVLAPAALAAPTPTITSPLDGQYTNLAEIPVTASVTGDTACGRLRLDATVGGDAVDVAPSGGLIAGTLPNVPEGLVTVRAYAWDAAGCLTMDESDAGKDSIRITVDRTAPDDFALDTTRPECLKAEGSLAIAGTGAPLVCWTSARDGLSGTAAYEVWVDGARHAAVSSSTRRVQLGGLSPGVHSLVLLAIDQAGNVRTSGGVRSLLVDTAAPTLSWAQPGRSVVWLRRRVPLLARSADLGGAGLERIVFSSRRPAQAGGVPRADLGEVFVPSGGASAQRVFHDTTTARDGRYEWTVTAVDRAGNHRTLKRVVRIDNTRPRFSRQAKRLRVSGRGDRRLLVRVSDLASPRVRTSILIRKGRKTIHRSRFRLARDTDVQRIVVPARVGSGNYRMTVFVRDLAGNTASKTFQLAVRRR